SMIERISVGSDMRATPPSLRMSAGTRSSAITAHAPASWAILACSGVTTSMITPPLSIWASPDLTLQEPLVVRCPLREPLRSATPEFYARRRNPPPGCLECGHSDALGRDTPVHHGRHAAAAGGGDLRRPVGGRRRHTG